VILVSHSLKFQKKSVAPLVLCDLKRGLPSYFETIGINVYYEHDQSSLKS